MDGTILTHLLLILLVGLLSWNNIPRVTPAPPNIKALKEKASAQDVFHLCENLKKTCVGGVAACANYSYSIKIKQLVCCLECNGETELIQTNGETELIQTNHNDPCEPDPCGKHGTCKVIHDTGFWCECEKRWGGELCDESNEYLDIKKKKCSIATCVAPNVCVPQKYLFAHLKSILWDKYYKRESGVHMDDMKVKDMKVEKLTEVIQRSSSRSKDRKVCLCSPGNRGIRCDLRCKSGTWGPYCLEKCDDNCLKPKCGSKDGKCKCKSGYVQNESGVCILQEATEDNCQKYCEHGKCRGANCTCNYAQGPFCETKCSEIKPHPRYGENCHDACGGCTKLPCDLKTGFCPIPIRFGAKLCLKSYFTGDRCELSDGVIAEAQMTLGKVDDSVPDDEFQKTLARIEHDQKKISLIKKNIRMALPPAIAVVGLVTGGLIGGAGVIFGGGAGIGLGILGQTAGKKIGRKGGFLKLLRYEEPGLVADISLPLPPGANSSTYKDVMQKIMENVAEGFQTDLIPGLGVRKESIRVTSVRAIEQPDVGNSPPDSLPLVVGGAIVATVAVVAALIALTLIKRKPSKNNARASIRPNNLQRKPFKNNAWASTRPNNMAISGTGTTQMIAVSQQQFGQQMRKTTETWV